MNEILKSLYDSFYTPPAARNLSQEIDECHRLLIECLDKPERKLVLRIIDCKDQLAEDLSIDSFISGFQLAWQLSNELNHYKNKHSDSRNAAVVQSAYSRQEEQ